MNSHKLQNRNTGYQHFTEPFHPQKERERSRIHYTVTPRSQTTPPTQIGSPQSLSRRQYRAGTRICRRTPEII